MKNKGFTLIELLGVIIILALLMTLAFPSIVNLVKNSSDKTDDLTLDLIYNAADMYISDHSTFFSKTEGKKFSIDLKDLVDEDYLISPIKLSDSDSDITNNKCIQVVYNNGYKYELKNKGECEKVCMPVTTATTGNVPQNDGTYRAGDEYICEVAPNIKHRFFVLNTVINPEKVDMIMYANINSSKEAVDGTQTQGNGLVAWDFSGYNTNGTMTAMNTLATTTSTWKNLSKQTISFFTDDNNSIHNIESIESYARLAYFSEIENYDNTNKTNEYLYNYLASNENVSITNNVENVYGYWLLSSSTAGTGYAWSVDSGGTLYSASLSSSNEYGLRPVITVPVSDIG